jgi:outer membrane protein TolC
MGSIALEELLSELRAEKEDIRIQEIQLKARNQSIIEMIDKVKKKMR